MSDKLIGKYVMNFNNPENNNDFMMGVEVNKDTEETYRFDLYFIGPDGKKWEHSNEIMTISGETLIREIIPDIIKDLFKEKTSNDNPDKPEQC